MQIQDKIINKDSHCFIIAEVGHNHGGSIDTAKELILEAKRCGADAVKLQKRENKSLFTKTFYNKPYENENSYGATYGEHREFLELSYKEYEELVDFCNKNNIIFFATAFDPFSAAFLQSINVPCFKVASADLTNTPLITQLIEYNKPLIISTGGGLIDDIDRVVKIVDGKVDYALLHCIATYPNKPEEMNLRFIKTMQRRYPNAIVGLSDHYNGIVMAEAAYMLGARIIEKHFTMNHTWKGTDHPLSLEPQGMFKMVRDIRRLHTALGDGEKKVLPNEKKAIEKMGKSLYAAANLPEGHIISYMDIDTKTPGGFIPPYQMNDVIGKCLLKSIKEEEPFKWENLV